MDRTHWQKVEEIVGRALDVDGSQRTAFLVRACGRDSSLLASCKTIFRAHLDAGDFLETPMSRDLPDLLAGDQPSHNHPTSVGPYQIIKCLGQGGMGSVYLARRKTRFARKVALKLARPGSVFSRDSRHFDLECRIMRQLRHPNIVRLLDVAVAGEVGAYFTMEYCEGLTLHRFCRRNDLAIRQRLALFLDVCSGVEHAHRMGVIHRDLKPENVMVMWRGGRSLAKVIDFGIAGKVGDAASPVRLPLNGQEVLGTPAYMSPEQASAGPLDARTDIYSLGVILYELITGKPPRHDGGHDSACPHSHEDLMRIALRAMAKDKSQRFASVRALALAVQDRLEQRPMPLAIVSRVGRVMGFSAGYA